MLGYVLVFMGIMPIHAYQKVCYVQPRYGRHGSYNDLAYIMNRGEFDGYVVVSPDGRKSCHVQLDAVDKARVKLVLDEYGVQGQITETIIQDLLESRKNGRKTVGWILRDFKYENERVTADQVRKALGIADEKSL